VSSPGQELRERNWEAVDSLLRTLGASLDVGEVIQRSLLTAGGQLLTRKVAFYLVDGETGRLRLCECLGVRRERLGAIPLPLTGPIQGFLREGASLGPLPQEGVPPVWHQHFQFMAPIPDGREVLGLLLLGGKLGAPDFSEEDLRLLRTAGMVIGTTLRRSMAYENLAESNRRLEKVQRLQRQIIDHVSHEFNTPLMILKSSLDLVDEPERDEVLDMQRRAVARLEQLVAGVLQVGHSLRHRGGPVALSRAELETQVLEPVLAASPWPTDRIQRVDETPGPEAVLADPEALRQALAASVENAWRFGGADGGCSLVLRLAEAGEKVALEVEDRGIGIPSDELELVFQPFVQASNSPTHGIAGAGMGLATCRKLMEEMGGAVELRSREGEGTVIRLLLPLASRGIG